MNMNIFVIFDGENAVFVRAQNYADASRLTNQIALNREGMELLYIGVAKPRSPRSLKSFESSFDIATIVTSVLVNDIDKTFLRLMGGLSETHNSRLSEKEYHFAPPDGNLPFVNRSLVKLIESIYCYITTLPQHQCARNSVSIESRRLLQWSYWLITEFIMLPNAPIAAHQWLRQRVFVSDANRDFIPTWTPQFEAPPVWSAPPSTDKTPTFSGLVNDIKIATMNDFKELMTLILDDTDKPGGDVLLDYLKFKVARNPSCDSYMLETVIALEKKKWEKEKAGEQETDEVEARSEVDKPCSPVRILYPAFLAKGFVVPVVTYGDALAEVVLKAIKFNKKVDVLNPGFVTSDGEWVTREGARVIAIAACQIVDDGLSDILTTSDLYMN